MSKQAILKSIVENKYTAFETALSNVATLNDLTYESDEAPLTLQVLNQAFSLPLIDLGDRIVQTEHIPFDVTPMSTSKVAKYINLLFEKGLSESEARDFVIAYYGVVASENEMVKIIDRTFLGVMCKQFDLIEPVTIALAKCLEEYGEKMTKNRWSYMEFLIAHGAEPNRTVDYSIGDLASPMRIAGKQGNIRLAKYFIEKGADAHDLLVGGVRIKTLLDEGIKLNIWPTEVAWDGETDATRFIQSLGADVPYKTVMGEFNYLLASGAKWNIANSSGEYPLENLMLVSKLNELPEMMVLQLCKGMIEHGSDVNKLNDADEMTPLMGVLSWFEVTGAINKHDSEYRYLVNQITTLLELGASVSKKNDQGMTALHYAAKFNPCLIPLLREHIDRAPSDLTEILLFSGAEKCLSMLESSAEVDEYSLQQVFYYAAMLKNLELVNSLLTRRFDVVVALEQSKNESQKNNTSRTYDIKLSKFMAKVQNKNLMPFWMDILMSDSRLRVKKIAQAWLTTALGEAATQSIMAERVEIEAKEQKLIRRQTRAFVVKLKALFTSLRQYKIFAVDINGSGWAPGDHGWEVAYEMISPKDLKEFDVDNDFDISICWTDTGYYKNMARQFNSKGRMQSAVTGVNVYYTAPNEAKRMEMASHITEVAVANGFQADWNGNTNRAVSLRLLMPTE